MVKDTVRDDQLMDTMHVTKNISNWDEEIVL